MQNIKTNRKRALIMTNVVIVIILTVAARPVLTNGSIRTVDIVMLLACGMAMGALLVGLISMIRNDRRADEVK